MRLHHIAILLLLVALTSCTTTDQPKPARSATEELIISTAADRAAEKLALMIPPKTSVFIDAGNFDGPDSKYATAAVRAHMLKQGVRLVDDKKKARTIVELRSGALSIDHNDFLLGIPQFDIPIPLATSPLTIPEIALYRNDEHKGIAKFAILAYDATQGKLIAEQEPQYGFAHKSRKTVLIFVSWNDSDMMPDEDVDTSPAAKDR
jgi:hypothetical protein